MTLMNRMTRLFKSDVHGILDQLEDPTATLKQAVREMEEAVTEDERKLDQLVKRERHLASLQGEIKKSVPEIEAQIQLCLKNGNDELCKTLLRRKLEEESRLHEIHWALGQVSEARTEASKRVEARREQLQAVTKKMEVFVDTVQESDVLGRRPRSVTDEDVEVALMKLKQGASK